MKNNTYVYGIERNLPYKFDDAIEKVIEALEKEGFGIITKIDVKETMKKKLDEDFLDYTILGACNPKFALDALKTDLDIGLLLPCNVIVYKDAADGVTVSAIDPVVMLNISGSEALGVLAFQVKERLQQAVESL